MYIREGSGQWWAQVGPSIPCTCSQAEQPRICLTPRLELQPPGALHVMPPANRVRPPYASQPVLPHLSVAQTADGLIVQPPDNPSARPMDSPTAQTTDGAEGHAPFAAAEPQAAQPAPRKGLLGRLRGESTGNGHAEPEQARRQHAVPDAAAHCSAAAPQLARFHDAVPCARTSLPGTCANTRPALARPSFAAASL